MKKVIKIIIIALTFVIFLCSVFICGCFGSCINDDKMGRYDDPWDYRQEEAGFYYYINTYDYEQDSAIILEIADLTKEIDELVIPQTLGGCPVVRVGEVWQMYGNHYYGIYANNIKNIIINHPIKICNYGILEFNGNLIINVPVEFIWESSSFPVKQSLIYSSLIQINYWRERPENTFFDQLKCEVFFEANGGEQTTYSVIIPINSKLIELDPPKKEGYDFAGWYKEKELENKWDYEKDLATENTILYAKWEEIK